MSTGAGHLVQEVATDAIVDALLGLSHRARVASRYWVEFAAAAVEPTVDRNKRKERSSVFQVS